MKRILITIAVLAATCLSVVGSNIALAHIKLSHQMPSARPTINEGYFADYTFIESVAQHYIANPLENFGMLDETSTDIVKGYLLDDRRQDIQYIENTKYVAFGCNISTLVITDVYKGDLKTGDQVAFAEKYYFPDGEETKIAITYEDYLPSIPGQEYVFFVSAAKSGRFAGVYTPNAYNYGRYPAFTKSETKRLPLPDLTARFNIRPDEKETDKYMDFLEAAVQKYN